MRRKNKYDDTMSHWTKFDHITFLIAFILAIINLFYNETKK